MQKILLPVAGTANDRLAVQQVIKRFANDSAMEVHLLNVQPPFDSHVANFSSRRSRNEFHREQAEKVGDPATAIVAAARRLQCDEIVMATARKNSLTRLVEVSVTDRVIERTPVPVEVVSGSEISKWERYGIPALIGAGLAMALAIAD